MTVTPVPCRIAPGWYRSPAQLTLCVVVGSGFRREAVDVRIVPPRCRFRVSRYDGDRWCTVESLGDSVRVEKLKD